MKKSTISLFSAFVGGMASAGIVKRMSGKRYQKISEMSDKHLELFLMMTQWVRIKQEGKNLSQYLKKNGFHRIAIYGMSYAGETLLTELKETETEVIYGIDRNADVIYTSIDVFSMEDNLKEVDAVVVTTITYFEEIKNGLGGKLKCPIISLKDIIFGESMNE